MKVLLGLVVVVVILCPVMAFACPPPAAPDYSGPDVSSGPSPSDPASGGSDGDGDGTDDSVSAPSDISTRGFTL